MKTASGLTVVAIGAILAFAVTRQPFFINLHIAGWALMLTGIAGMLMPRRGYGWLRRRTVVRRGPRGQIARVEDQRYPPYITINPDSPPIEQTALASGDTDEFSPANGGVGEPPETSYTEVRSAGYTEGHPPASAYRAEPPNGDGYEGGSGVANPSTVTERPPRRGLRRLRQAPAEETVEEFLEE